MKLSNDIKKTMKKSQRLLIGAILCTVTLLSLGTVVYVSEICGRITDMAFSQQELRMGITRYGGIQGIVKADSSRARLSPQLSRLPSKSLIPLFLPKNQEMLRAIDIISYVEKGSVDKINFENLGREKIISSISSPTLRGKILQSIERIKQLDISGDNIYSKDRDINDQEQREKILDELHLSFIEYLVEQKPERKYFPIYNSIGSYLEKIGYVIPKIQYT